MSLFFNQDTAPSQLLPEQGPPGPPGPTGPQGPAGTTEWDGITGKPTSFTPSAHKSSHATGGTDALTPSDIGAATAAQGAKADTALQGNASCVIDINSTSPALRVTQKGTGDVLVVENEEHPDRTPFIIDRYGVFTIQGFDGVLNLYTPEPNHNRIGFDFGTTTSLDWIQSRLLLWTFKQDPAATNSENFGIRRQKGFVSDQGPLVVEFGQNGSHTAGDNWLFTGNVAISGSLTASAIATAITSAVAPATSGSVGSAGSVRYDGDYIYICTATNTWRRTAVTSW